MAWQSLFESLKSWKVLYLNLDLFTVYSCIFNKLTHFVNKIYIYVDFMLKNTLFLKFALNSFNLQFNK